MRQAQSCNFNGQIINDGQSVTAYLSNSVPFGSSCISETRNCNDGFLSGNYAFGSCAVTVAASCNFNGQNIHSGNTGNTASGMYRQKPTNVVRPGSATSRSSVNNRESPVTRIARDRSAGSIQSGMSAVSNASAGKKSTPKRRVVVRR